MNIIVLEQKKDTCHAILGDKIVVMAFNKEAVLTGIPVELGHTYNGEWEDVVVEPTKAIPSTACFVKLSEDEMFVISKYKPSNVANSYLLVTDFQGNKANENDIYEDILIN